MDFSSSTDTPKSQILISPSSFNKILEGFMSEKETDMENRREEKSVESFAEFRKLAFEKYFAACTKSFAYVWMQW